jgi:CTP:molybdopterin cytidylyltransferase MocA
MIQPIILAAGLGSRMHAVKALLPIHGSPALAVVLRTIREAGLTDPIVVLGHAADDVCASGCLEGCVVIRNPHPEAGMGTSMELGIDALHASASGLLLFHVDMPFLSPATIHAVVRAAQDGASLVAPMYRGQRGFPVYFAREHVAALKATLDGDRGGREYLATQEEALVLVPVEDPGAIHDIDVPADLARWKGAALCTTNE